MKSFEFSLPPIDQVVAHRPLIQQALLEIGPALQVLWSFFWRMVENTLYNRDLVPLKLFALTLTNLAQALSTFWSIAIEQRVAKAV